ncbi:MAG: hypothetical protein QW112_02295, partial [Candidatus Micrarchaeia archaeon]
MLKKGKFVSIEAGRVIEMPHVEEEPTDADSKHGTQSFISAQPAEIQQAQQKPKYWQPMSSVADSSSQAQTAGILSQSESKREVAGPEAVAHKNVSRSLFGIVLPMGQKKEQADTTYKPEPGSEKYSNALSRMAP